MFDNRSKTKDASIVWSACSWQIWRILGNLRGLGMIDCKESELANCKFVDWNSLQSGPHHQLTIAQSPQPVHSRIQPWPASSPLHRLTSCSGAWVRGWLMRTLERPEQNLGKNQKPTSTKNIFGLLLSLSAALAVPGSRGLPRPPHCWQANQPHYRSSIKLWLMGASLLSTAVPLHPPSRPAPPRQILVRWISQGSLWSNNIMIEQTVVSPTKL